eukprot:3566974-Rhodomonas_salina.3
MFELTNSLSVPGFCDRDPVRDHADEPLPFARFANVEARQPGLLLVQRKLPRLQGRKGGEPSGEAETESQIQVCFAGNPP